MKPPTRKTLFLILSLLLLSWSARAALIFPPTGGTDSNYVYGMIVANNVANTNGASPETVTNIVLQNAILKLNGFGTNVTLLGSTNYISTLHAGSLFLPIGVGVAWDPNADSEIFASDTAGTKSLKFNLTGSTKLEIFENGTIDAQEGSFVGNGSGLTNLQGVIASNAGSGTNISTYNLTNHGILLLDNDSDSSLIWNNGMKIITYPSSWGLWDADANLMFSYDLPSSTFTIPEIAKIEETLYITSGQDPLGIHEDGGVNVFTNSETGEEITFTNGNIHASQQINANTLAVTNLNQGNATVALGIDGATGLLTTNNVPGGATALAFVNTNLSAGIVVTQGNNVMIGTNVEAAQTFSYTNIIAQVASVTWSNNFGDDAAQDTGSGTNKLTFTIPVSGQYRVKISGFTLRDGGGSVDSTSAGYVMYQAPGGSWITTVGVDTIQDSTSAIYDAYSFPAIDGIAGQQIILSNYYVNGFTSGLDARATNHITAAIYGPTNLVALGGGGVSGGGSVSNNAALSDGFLVGGAGNGLITNVAVGSGLSLSGGTLSATASGSGILTAGGLGTNTTLKGNATYAALTISPTNLPANGVAGGAYKAIEMDYPYTTPTNATKYRHVLYTATNTLGDLHPDIITTWGMNFAGNASGTSSYGPTDTNQPYWMSQRESRWQNYGGLSQLEWWDAFGTPYTPWGTNTSFRFFGADLVWNTASNTYSFSDATYKIQQFNIINPLGPGTYGFKVQGTSMTTRAMDVTVAGTINIETNDANNGALTMKGGQINLQAPDSVTASSVTFRNDWNNGSGFKPHMTITGAGTAKSVYFVRPSVGDSITNFVFGTNVAFHAGIIVSNAGIAFRQLTSIPTNWIPASSAGITNWVLCNLSNTINGGGPMYVATNYGAADSFIFYKPTEGGSGGSTDALTNWNTRADFVIYTNNSVANGVSWRIQSDGSLLMTNSAASGKGLLINTNGSLTWYGASANNGTLTDGGILMPLARGIQAGWLSMPDSGGIALNGYRRALGAYTIASFRPLQTTETNIILALGINNMGASSSYPMLSNWPGLSIAGSSNITETGFIVVNSDHSAAANLTARTIYANDVYATNDVSALTFTDRSSSPTNDADALAIVLSGDVKNGKVDHDKLSPLVWGKSLKPTGKIITNIVDAVDEETGLTNKVDLSYPEMTLQPDQTKRDLSMMVSAQNMVIKQLLARVAALETKIPK